MTVLPSTFERTRRRMLGRAALQVVEEKQDDAAGPDLSAPNPHHGSCPRCWHAGTSGMACLTPGCGVQVA